MKKLFAVSIAVLFISTASVMAAVPHMINYQGYLTDTGGEPLDTTVAMTFTMYDAATFGTQLWTESHPSITVQEGLFDTLLGSVNAIPDSVFADTIVWLGITVGGDSEMSPRTQVVSVAYAYRVGTVDGATGGIITGKVNMGLDNTNAGEYAFVTGSNNIASGDYSVVAGGGYTDPAFGNTASGFNAVISGGYDNIASGEGSFVAGGYRNNTTNTYAAIGGGMNNDAAGYTSVVGGGQHNNASGYGNTIGGGRANNTGGEYSTVSGGRYNNATNDLATVGGGKYNYARGLYSVIAGGGGADAADSNSASGDYSAIGGGQRNIASGAYATVPGGLSNTAQGDYSFAAGRRAKANHRGCFIWGDATDAPISTSEQNQIRMRGAGGTQIFSNAGMSAGVHLPSSANAWISISDSTKKRNIRLVNTKEVLNKVAQLPIKQWSYKSQDPSIEHIGPMAQDFWKLFHLGEDSLGISTIDPDGIALAAIQELQKQNEQLKKELNELRSLVEKMASRQTDNQIKTTSAVFVPNAQTSRRTD